VKAGLKGRETACRANVDSPHADVKSYNKDKPPVLILTDCGTGERHAIPAKVADELTIRLYWLTTNRSR